MSTTTLPTPAVHVNKLLACAGTSLLFAALSAYNLFQDGGLACLGFGIPAVVLGWISFWSALRESPNASRGFLAFLGFLIGALALVAFGTLALVGWHLQQLRGTPGNSLAYLTMI